MMTNLILDDLFPSSHKSKMKVAEDAEGKQVHVDSVANGLGCQCVCTVCNGKLVAKNKGQKQEHHFSHLAESLDNICRSAGETALHKIAKEYLATSLKLTLPELKVNDGENVETILQRTFDFSAATLEKAVGQIVPDVVVTRENGRKLIVEFKVTHGCDDDKIAKIVSRNIGAIEVDLSQYRHLPILTLADVILHSAPRKWLYSPITAKLLARIENKKLKKLQEKQLLAKHIVETVIRPLSELQKSINSHQVKWQNRKFPAQFRGFEMAPQNELFAQNSDLVPQGCFRVRSIEWQSALFEHVFLNSYSRFSADDFLKVLIAKGFVDGKLACNDNEVLELVYPRIAYVHPAITIWNFLNKSASFDKLQTTSGATKIWQLSAALKNEIQLRKLANARRKKLKQTVEKILRNLPQEEIIEFDFEKWCEFPIASTDCSFEQALRFHDTDWNKLAQKIEELSSNKWPSQHLTPYLFGLPLEGERDRRLAVLAAEADEKKNTESVDRTELLSALAVHELADDAEEFLSSPNALLNKISPFDAAKRNNEGFEKAKRALYRHSQNLQNQKIAAQQHLLQKQLLLSAVLAVCKDKVFAELWCKSQNKELGWQKPYEYCLNAKSRAEAEALFKSHFKKKPNFLTQ